MPAAGADPLYGPHVLPRDSRTATEGVRGKLRWSQTRLGRNVRPGPGLRADRLDLSEDARRRGAGGDLAAAQDMLDEILAELGRRGMAQHPRTKALLLLKHRLQAEAGPGQAAAETPAQPGWLDLLGDMWDTLLGMVQQPAERAEHRKVLLKEIRERTDQGDTRGATRRLELLLQRDPGDAEAHAQLGRMLMDQGDLAGAEPHLRAAAEARPGDPARHIALGELAYHRGDPPEALVAFGKALRLRPEHSDANAWLGILAHEGDRPVEAMRFLERAIAFDPNHAVARYYLAQVSLAQGDKLRAGYQLDIVRRLEPAADLERFAHDEPKALPAHTGNVAYTGWVVPKPGRLAGSPTY